MKLPDRARSFVYSAGVALYAALLIGIVTTDDTDGVRWSSVALGALPGFLVGWLLSIIANAGAHLENRLKDLDESVARIRDDLNAHDIPALLEKAQVCLDHYVPLRNVLNTHKEQVVFVRSLIDRAMESYFSIPKAEPSLFYDYLIDGLDKGREWDGIHQGSLALLGNNPPDRTHGLAYFRALRVASTNGTCRTRRIIILNESQQVELTNRKIMNEFWENSGRNVESYWIPQDEVQSMLPQLIVTTLDDCALYDSRIVLHYERDAKVITIAFDGSNSPVAVAIKIIFAQLDRSQKGPTSYTFKKITQKTIDALCASRDQLV